MTMNRLTSPVIIDSVVQEICGAPPVHLEPILSGGLHETYLAHFSSHRPLIVRIARGEHSPFAHEAGITSLARGVGVPAPRVVGHLHETLGEETLSFSVLEVVLGHSIQEARLVDPAELIALVRESGELLARLGSISPAVGIRHELHRPLPERIGRAAKAARRAIGPTADSLVERGAEVLTETLDTASRPVSMLTHGDWLPKHLFVDDHHAIVGVIDWEFAGPAPIERELARWEVAARAPFHDLGSALEEGYLRTAPAHPIDERWVGAFAIEFALEILGWQNPASIGLQHRCVEVIRRYAL